jgi:hypothetical protein
MLSINKQDVFKTILILWFIATTSYFVYDQYFDYKVKGIKAAYDSGYATAVDDLIKETKKGTCQPFEVTKGEEKASLISADCIPQQQESQEVPQK